MKKMIFFLMAMHVGVHIHGMDCIRSLFKRGQGRVHVASSSKSALTQSSVRSVSARTLDGETKDDSAAPGPFDHLYPSDDAVRFIQKQRQLGEKGRIDYLMFAKHIKNPLEELLGKNDHDPVQIQHVIQSWKNVVSACYLVKKLDSFVQFSANRVMNDLDNAGVYYEAISANDQLRSCASASDADKVRADALIARVNRLRAYSGSIGEPLVSSAYTFITGALNAAEQAEAAASATGKLPVIVEDVEQ